MRTGFKKTALLLIILSFIISMVLGGCRKPTPEPVERPNLLVAATGDVRLKREGWTEYIPAGFGTLLQYDDLLKVEGSATVLCGDLTTVSIDGRDSCPCPPAPGRLAYRGAYFRGTSVDIASAAQRNVPYTLYPRNTLVASPKPLLRWHETGVTSYTVSLVTGGETIWSQPDVTGDRIRYPDDAPKLHPETDYLLVVRDNATSVSSMEDPTKGIGFRVLSEAEREAVGKERDAILPLEYLDEPSRQLALALYYATYPPSAEENERRLWGEAWLLLESVAEERDSPVVFLWMGGTLAAMKLPEEAKAAYQMALERAGSLGDLESQAAAHAGLWRVTRNEDEFEQAIALYEQLGDQGAVKALEEEQER